MPGFTKAEFIWMNGEMLPWDSAQTHVSAHGLQYGTGVFEGMFAEAGHVRVEPEIAASAVSYDASPRRRRFPY